MEAMVSVPDTVDSDPSQQLVTDVFARHCASRAALQDVAGKWATLCLMALGEGDHRFGALRRKVDGVSEKMLSQTLQVLERDGLIERRAQETIPPRVDYSLTDLGAEIASRLRDLADLLEGSTDQISVAQQSYDERRGARAVSFVAAPNGMVS
jgi:DNA-binding HxlR family transcriptional regulator